MSDVGPGQRWRVGGAGEPRDVTTTAVVHQHKAGSTVITVPFVEFVADGDDEAEMMSRESFLGVSIRLPDPPPKMPSLDDRYICRSCDRATVTGLCGCTDPKPDGPWVRSNG